jgi:RND family efflux transporter MFP subunit
MRYTEPDQPESQELAAAEAAKRLEREVEDLKRQLREQQRLGAGSSHAGPAGRLWHPSAVTIAAIFIGTTVLIAGAFLAGYIPLAKRNVLLRSEAQQQEQALPRVEVIQVTRSSPNSELELPGDIQAITEAPILARADGYLARRLVDIGDRVQAGQLVAEIAAPELDQQVSQAKANLQQAQAALEQALANQEQGKANLELARVTAERWGSLQSQGVVSKQDNDQYQASYRAQLANVQALEKAVAAQRSNIAAAEANLARLVEMDGYRLVKAPFDGVITVRNLDAGALVGSGSTLLFRIAQTGTLRTYVNVPQANATFIHPGQPAKLRVTSFPGRSFSGTVARTANALDPASRTLLVEVRVPNADGALLPGMYTQVDLSLTQAPQARAAAPLLVPADALIVRAEGTEVAVVRPDHRVHLQKIEPGRDYGDRLEILAGLQEGDTIIPNPVDLSEGTEVNPVRAAEKGTAGSGVKK